MVNASHPILTCAAARELEAGLFGGDESKEWAAMQSAGRAIAFAVERDFLELSPWPEAARILVLVGKGHNGGDALIAAAALLERHREARADVALVFGHTPLRPLAARSWRELAQRFAGRVREVGLASSDSRPWERRYDVGLDGVFGFQFRPPVEARIGELFERVNGWPIGLRAAVDLPSADTFRADFTYATGSVKTPVVGSPRAGRVRYLDLGFFDRPHSSGREADRVLRSEVLKPLGCLRPALSDKRTFGHVFVVAGSRNFPGAALMAVLAALRSGAGLVTAFVPESVAAGFAARAPEAMWVAWPETPTGGLALEGEYLWRDKLERATAAVIGPGLGREPETLALAAGLVRSSPVPMVIDADALQPDIVSATRSPSIVTPHAGEFARISGGRDLREFVVKSRVTAVLKGPVTRVGGVDPEEHPKSGKGQPGGLPVYHSFFGGPVLARGGSGDLLAGLIGGILAGNPQCPLLAALQGVAWHGLAADYLAQTRGQVATSVTELLDCLGPALRRV